MKLEGFNASADIWGGRALLRWSFVLAPGENAAAVPRLLLLRKERDFEYSEVPAGTRHPFTVYDSRDYPGPDASVRLLPPEDLTVDGVRTLREVESVVRGGAEILRLTRTTVFEGSRPARVELLIVDSAEVLRPLVTYYYELRPEGAPASDVPLRATAMISARHGLGRRSCEMLPEIYRRHDIQRHPRFNDPESLPEEAEPGGQLRRMIDLFGSCFDHLRSQAEGLMTLHDVDNVDANWLPYLAAWIGWDLSYASSIPVQRHEIRYAPALYRITGTIPGSMIWVKRLTGWESRIKEFGRNVFFSNDLGNPDDPTDHGSRTVDPDNAAAMAAVGTIDDDLDYTYDPRGTDDAWYAYNTVGIFLRPADGAAAAEIRRMELRLKRNLDIFLPVNVRGVIIVDLPRERADVSGSVTLLDTEVN
jgi:phage tail-like protein